MAGIRQYLIYSHFPVLQTSSYGICVFVY